MSRVFERRRVWSLAQATCDAGCALLSAAVTRRFAPAFDATVAVARGGCQPAGTIAARLEIPMVIVRARHNSTDAVRSPASDRVEVEASEIGCLPEQPRLLVVDDICGSGATLEAVNGMLRSLVAPRELRTAVLCRNGGSPLSPDMWIWDVRDWVVFPWEAPPEIPVEPLSAPTLVRFGG